MRNRAPLPLPRALVGAVFVLLVPLAACGDDDADTTGTTTTTTQPDTTTTAEATTTTSGDESGAAPDDIAAVLADGTLALLDAGTGDVRQTLLEGIDVSDPAKNGITVSSDGDDIFVVRPGQRGANHEIVRVPAGGGEPEVVAEGRAPAVSPDGSTLAYVAVEPTEEPGQPAPYLVLHDLDSGEERELRREQQPGYYFIVDVAWTGDGEQLAFVVGEIQTGLHMVAADADSLDAAERIGPDAREDGASWTAVTAFDDERLAVVETCCDVPPQDSWHVLAVDVGTGAVEGTLLPEERVEASRVDSDRTTDHLVLVAQLRPEGGTLLRWSSPHAADGERTDGAGVGEVVELRDDVVVAAW